MKYMGVVLTISSRKQKPKGSAPTFERRLENEK